MSWMFIFQKRFSIRRAAPDRQVRARVLERQRPQQPLPGRGRTAATPSAAWSASSRRASASSPSCAGSAAPTRATWSTARAARCAPPSSARWTSLERHLAFLASVGSVSPYIGLFGTVWGIMNAFRGLANVQQATLAAGRAGHRRGADRDRDRPVRRDSGGGRLQPLLARHRPARQPLRELHGGVLQHPAAPGELTVRAPWHASAARASARSRCTRSTSCPTST